jgi:hypothetical protein
MRKVVAPLVALAVLGAALVSPTVAQTPVTEVTVDSKVSPNRAGTKANPQGVTLSGTIRWKSQEGIEPPIITAFDIFIAKGGLYNGAKYPKCSQAVANRNGPQACPKKSIMGSATGVALADQEITRPKVTFINGGARNICFYTVLTNPARVETCVPGKITKLRGNRKWGYRVQIRVPEVLQVVAGVPIALREIKFKAGGRRYAKDWIATTSCPKNRKWGFQVETFYLYNDGSTSSSQFADSIACRRAR